MPYTQDELRTAFEKVQAKNWKDPINKIVPAMSTAQREVVIEAVIHFTGSVPTFTRLDGGRERVQAAGYYATIGA